MKKWLCAVLALMLMLSVTACGDEPVQEPEAAPAPVEDQTEQKEEVKPETSETDEPEEKQEETQEEEQPAEQKGPENVSAAPNLSDIRTAMIDTFAIENPLLLEKEGLINLYGFAAEHLMQAVGYATMAGTFPDEIIMVEAVDEAAAAAVAEKLQARLDEVLVQSKSYDPENYKAAQACEVQVDGLLVCLILSPNQAELAELYAGSIQ